MKDILLFVAGLAIIAMPVYFFIICIIDYLDRNKTEKQSLIKQIEQYQNTIRENEAKAEAKMEKYERDRISRDIKLALGYTNDQLVNIVMEYCPGELMSVDSLDEMEREIHKAKDNYDFDNFIKAKYLPIIGNEDFWIYHSRLLELKSLIRLHKELSPQDIIGQIDFYWQNDSRNINEVELLSCIKSINPYLEPYDDFEFFTNDEIKDIAKLITEHFDICITEEGMEGVLHPSDHSSYHRSTVGISRIFARVLFKSEDVYSQLSALDDKIFVSTIEKYFFYKVYYDVKKFKVFLPEIINYVKQHRTFMTNI